MLQLTRIYEVLSSELNFYSPFQGSLLTELPNCAQLFLSQIQTRFQITHNGYYLIYVRQNSIDCLILIPVTYISQE
jgi:hypothetical protein